MSVKSCEKLEKSTVVLTVEVGAADFEAAVEKAYKKQRGRINVPGFRPGKAPRKMIERMYGASIFYEDAVNEALPDAYESAVKEQGLEVVGYPQVELESVGAEGFTFKATVPVYPEVTLGQYKGLEAPRAEAVVTDDDVNARLAEMAERNSRMVDQDRPAQNGDIANIDFEGFLEGVPFDGGKGENFDLTLGSGSFVPGFEEQVVGMSAGEEKDIDITFPENYHEGLAGKAVVFHVKVNAVKVKELPELDDEFAKDVSEEIDTLEELKADVRAKLMREREEAGQRAFEDTVMGKAAANITAEIPDVMVENQAEQMVRNLVNQLRAQGISKEQYMQMMGTDEAGLKEQAMGPALDQVRMDLTISAIVKAEGIEASDEEVEAEYAAMAGRYSMDVEQLKQYMQAEVVREQVIRSKAIAVVAGSAVAVAPEAPAVEETAAAPAKESSAEAPAGEEAVAVMAPAEEAPAKPKRKRSSKKKTEEVPTGEESAE